MIASNFIKYPEALRFQREMFSSGYHNSPRIMRLMECVFAWSATVPDWWKEAKGRARDLARRVKKSINDFFKDMAVKASDQLSLVFTNPPATKISDVIIAVEGFTFTHYEKLYEAKVRNIDDLADLTPDEMMEITGLDEETACNALSAARAHWFDS